MRKLIWGVVAVAVSAGIGQTTLRPALAANAGGVDEAAEAPITTTTIKDDVYAFIFNQKGLMGGAHIQGSKITKASRSQA